MWRRPAAKNGGTLAVVPAPMYCMYEGLKPGNLYVCAFIHTTVLVLANVSLVGDELRFSFLSEPKIGLPDTGVLSTVKRAGKIENSASIAQQR